MLAEVSIAITMSMPLRLINSILVPSCGRADAIINSVSAIEIRMLFVTRRAGREFSESFSTRPRSPNIERDVLLFFKERVNKAIIKGMMNSKYRKFGDPNLIMAIF